MTPSLSTPPGLARRLLVGTAALVAVVVGSGIAAQQLSPGQVGLQLLQNSTATMLGLAVLILLFGPVSGAHFNPVVSAADWLLGRRTHTGLSGRDVWSYTAAQVTGAVAGAALANVMSPLRELGPGRPRRPRRRQRAADPRRDRTTRAPAPRRTRSHHQGLTRLVIEAGGCGRCTVSARESGHCGSERVEVG